MKTVGRKENLWKEDDKGRSAGEDGGGGDSQSARKSGKEPQILWRRKRRRRRKCDVGEMEEKMTRTDRGACELNE